MKAVILAAGFGSRLRTVSESKPLTPVAGSPLIEHVIRAAAAAGVRDFRVVTGHAADLVEDFLPGLALRLGVRVESIRTPDWALPNGHSVLAGTAGLVGDYLLMMSDHLFDPEIAVRLLGLPRRDDGVTLAVDRDLGNPLLDLDDATRVEVAEDGAILNIGKMLPRFDAVDTGLFRATPALADAIRAAVAKGCAGSLSEGVQWLAGARKAWTVDVTGHRWIDVDDPRGLALAAAMTRSRDSIGDDAA